MSYWPKLALSTREFIVTDLSGDVEVTQTSIQIQWMPFTRIRGSSEEVYFMTIMAILPQLFRRKSDVANALPSRGQSRSEYGSSTMEVMTEDTAW